VRLGAEQKKTFYAMFSIFLSKESEQLVRQLPSVFAAILHKPAIKNPIMTPAKSHAANHIGHPFSPDRK